MAWVILNPSLMTRNRSARWALTVNNYGDDDCQNMANLADKLSALIVIGKEMGISGTPHLQCYIEFPKPREFGAVKKMFPKAHIEKARGNRLQNIDYCIKENEVFANTFPKSLNEILLGTYDNITWRNWQQNIIDLCEDTPDNRTIYWFWEPDGNVGKSFLAKYLDLKYDMIICDGKKADVFNQALVWKQNHPEQSPKLIVLDIPRTSKDFVNYGVIEQLKNGHIYSGKYEGGKFLFMPPHVICFANSMPEEEKVSLDRWNITKINN